MKKIKFWIHIGRVFVALLYMTVALRPAEAATVPVLPAPGTFVSSGVVLNSPRLIGMTVDPEQPFVFDFFIDQGDSQVQKDEARKLIRYYLAALTTPEKNMWVNLSPFESHRIVPDSFGRTVMGRDLLAQDYLLKQLTATLLHPDHEQGQKFWDRIYEKAYQQFGTTNIPVETFHKVWIVPEKADVYVNGNTVFVEDAHLKIMVEEDYWAEQVTSGSSQPAPFRNKVQESSRLSTEVMKSIIIPEIEREVNEGAHFAPLRQIYDAVILAAWYKTYLKDSVLAVRFADQEKVNGLESRASKQTDDIYQMYVDAFRRGTHAFIREEYDAYTDEMIPRKYFSGGFVMKASPILRETDNTQLTVDRLSGKNITRVTGDYLQAGEWGLEEQKQWDDVMGSLTRLFNERRLTDNQYDQAKQWRDDLASLFDINPIQAKQLLKEAVQQQSSPVDFLDFVLGLDLQTITTEYEPTDTLLNHARRSIDGEQTIFVKASSSVVTQMARRMPLTERHVFYDLGAGYGRVLFYMALMTEARQLKGIELVPERVEAMRAVKKRFHFDRVRIEEGSVLDADFSDGNIFFMFNPFDQKTLNQVAQSIRQLSRQKRILVAYTGEKNVFRTSDWLQYSTRIGDIEIYASDQAMASRGNAEWSLENMGKALWGIVREHHRIFNHGVTEKGYVIHYEGKPLDQSDRAIYRSSAREAIELMRENGFGVRVAQKENETMYLIYEDHAMASTDAVRPNRYSLMQEQYNGMDRLVYKNGDLARDRMEYDQLIRKRYENELTKVTESDEVFQEIVSRIDAMVDRIRANETEYILMSGNSAFLFQDLIETRWAQRYDTEMPKVFHLDRQRFDRFYLEPESWDIFQSNFEKMFGRSWDDVMAANTVYVDDFILSGTKKLHLIWFFKYFSDQNIEIEFLADRYEDIIDNKGMINSVKGRAFRFVYLLAKWTSFYYKYGIPRLKSVDEKINLLKRALADQAVVSNTGGVDFNTSSMRMNIRQDAAPDLLTLRGNRSDDLKNIQGLVPVIHSMQPVQHLPQVLGLSY